MASADQLVQKYFEKAVALVLSSAGIETVEKQALHLLASEARRYADSLSAHASLLAEAARRTECTAEDIEAAAKCIAKNRNRESSGVNFTVNSELKKKLRLSVDIDDPIETPVEANILFPQAAPDSVDQMMLIHQDGIGSPAKSTSKRLTQYPEWLQTSIQSKQLDALTRIPVGSRNTSDNMQLTSANGNSKPLSFISALVQAEEESREILTKQLKTEVGDEHLQKEVIAPHS